MTTEHKAALPDDMIERASLAYEVAMDGEVYSPEVPRIAMRAAIDAAMTTWRSAIRKSMDESKRLRSALAFYAQHDSWMGVTEDAGARTLLVAAGGNASSIDGWAVAEDALSVNVDRLLAFVNDGAAHCVAPEAVQGLDDKSRSVLATMAASLDARADWSANSRERDTPGTVELMRSASAELKRALTAAPEGRDAVPPREGDASFYGLYDGQWVNIVNHAECYRDFTKEEAVAQAVKLTYAALRENNTKFAAAPASGEAQDKVFCNDPMCDQVLSERDHAESIADRLANAIGGYFGQDVGEHSNLNCPWTEALEVIENATPADDAGKDARTAAIADIELMIRLRDSRVPSIKQMRDWIAALQSTDRQEGA